MSAATATASPPPVGSPEVLTAWRRQLKPWLTALHEARLQVHLPPLATVSDMEQLWLPVHAPSERRNNATVWTLLIEALELLELLARVDHMSAWRLLFEAAGRAYLLDLYGEQLLPTGTEVLPRFLVHIGSDELLEETEITIQSCIRLIVANEQTSSPKLGRVRELLLRQWKEGHDGREFDRETEGRVKISLNFHASMDFEDEGETKYVFSQIQNVAFAHSDVSLLERVDRAGETGDEGDEHDVSEDGDEDEQDQEDQEETENEEEDEEEEDEQAEGGIDHLAGPVRDGETRDEEGTETEQFRNPNPPPRGPFVIESFRYELMDHPVSNMLLYMINEAGKSGMCMSHVKLSTVWHERLHHSVIGGFLLNQLVPWRGRRDILGISNLSIELGSFDAAGVRAFCTAIAHTRSLREFQFATEDDLEENPIRAEGDVWWPWLAYALFSGDADHQIHTVLLNVESLRVEHLDVVRQVLTHNDPLAFLYARVLGQASAASLETSQAMSASLNPSALLRLGHHRVIVEGADAPSVRVREPGVTYQIVCNRPNEDYIEVLLPGTGVCWTERGEILELHPLTRREQHPIRKLSIHGINDDSAAGFIDLLSLVGEPLEELTINDMHDEITTTVFRSIRASCKNLRRLNLHSCAIKSFDWLCDAEWALESLQGTLVAEDDAASWSRLFMHLSDPSTMLSKTLRELHLDVGIGGKQDALLSQCREMLGKNHRLVRCEVSGCCKPDFAKHEKPIMAHHDEPICIENAPLSRAAKLAFLSAMTPPATSTHERKRAKVIGNGETAHRVSARTKLDPPVLRTIMQMAAECERRVCGISSFETETRNSLDALLAR